MKLKHDDSDASKVQTILLDGKRLVKSVVKELDTDEGWIDCLHMIIPKTSKDEQVQHSSVVDTTKKEIPAAAGEWETRRLHGKVEVIWNDGTTTRNDSVPEEGTGEESR